MNDVGAERAVLAGVWAYGADAYGDVADMVRASSFTQEVNQVVWRCLEHVLKDSHDGRVDYPSVLSAAKSLGLEKSLASQEDRSFLRAIANFPVERKNVSRLAGKISKLEIARLLDGQLEAARSNLAGVTGDEPVDRILAMAEGPVFDFTSLLKGQDGGVRLMGEGAEEYARHLIDNPREMMGIPTGFRNYDASIGGGLRPNSLDVIAARPKTGKSWLVDNVALNIAGKQGVPVLNLDTEMSWEEHLHRVLGNLAGVQVRDVETGRVGLKDASKRKVLDAAARLKDMPYHYECVIGKGFEEVLASMRRWVTRTVGLDANGKAKPCVVIYDYLKMMSGDFLSNDLKEYQALGFIATALKNFMGRFAAACLCFAQQNRDGIDREDTDTIAGSDRIVHYCTSLSLYKWKTEEERAEAGPASRYTHKLINLVSRHGEGMRPGDYINVLAEYGVGRVREGPTRSQLASGRGIVADDPDQPPVGQD